MRFKLLGSFGFLLMIVLFNSALMPVTEATKPVIEGKSVATESRPQVKNRQAISGEKVDSSIKTESEMAQALDQMLTEVTIKGESGEEEVLHCKALLYRTLQLFPEKNRQALKYLVLNFDSTARRGLGSGSRIKLRCADMSDQELVAVTIHELGHVYDLGILKGSKKTEESEFRDEKTPIYEDDLSLDFYRISWETEKKTKEDSSYLDFVSTYAETDAFEDFAETMLFYRLNGTQFRKFASVNDYLQRKYDFMKNKVFAGVEFESLVTEKMSIARRDYDSTVMEYDLSKLLGS